MSLDNIERLKTIEAAALRVLYHKVFATPEGALVLEDLKGRFFEYAPPRSMEEVGSQKVLIHIKNTIMFPAGVVPEVES